MKWIKEDCKGNKVFVGSIITNLYRIGNPDGVVIFENNSYSVRDSDGDLLDLDSVIKSGAYVKQLTN